MNINICRFDLELARNQLSLHDFCSKAGIPYPSLAQIRSGKTKPRPKTIGKIAAALEIDPEELVLTDGGERQ